MSIDRVVGVSGISLSLIGTGIVALWPDKRWLGWVIIGAGLGIAILASVWAAARWHAKREYEQNLVLPSKTVTHAEATLGGINVNVSPTISPHINQSSAIAQKQSQSRKDVVPSKPNLICLGTRKLNVFGDEYRVIHELKPGMQSRESLQAIVVEFLNSVTTERPIAQVDNVKAHIIFSEIGGNEVHRIDAGTWLGKGKPFIDFEIGNTERLIVAIQYDNGVTNVVSARQEKHPRYDWIDVYLTERQKLLANAYNVQVQLVLDTTEGAKLALTQAFKLDCASFTISDEETKFSLATAPGS